MKLTTGILVLTMTVGSAWAQNPDVIENTRNTMKALQQKKAIESNAALAGTQGQSTQPSAPAENQSAAPAQAKPSASKARTSSATSEGASGLQSSATSGGISRTPTAPKAAATAAAARVKPVAGLVPKSKAAQHKPTVAAKSNSEGDPIPEKQHEKKYSMTGKRDPFLSPVVNHMGGSGCSTGKKCLAIEQINLRGVVRSDAGMIAVVSNELNKAYFLRENDPVFNGYVVKITGDSIVFKQTFQDRLGKSSTRDVTKKIFTPAV